MRLVYLLALVYGGSGTSQPELLFNPFFDPFSELEQEEMRKPKLRTKKMADSKPLISSGSAGGSNPVASSSDSMAGLVVEVHVGKELEVPSIGTVLVEAILYDEAVESKIYRVAKKDCPSEKFALKTFIPKKRGDFAEIDSEIAALRTLGDTHVAVKLIAAPDDIFKTPKLKDFRMYVTELLGVSLAQLIDSEFVPHGVAPEALSRIAVEGITALEAVHAHSLVHGDMGVGNIMFSGLELKLIDFGYAKPFQVDGVHVEPGKYSLPALSRSLLSLSELDGHFPSRRDDMFRFGEALLKMFGSDYGRMFKSRDVGEIKKVKMTVVPSKCCSGAPVALDRYFDHVRSLDYTAKPDYEYLRRLFAQS